MISGFNTDIEFDGVVYHVQTEDKGLSAKLIVSLVYDRGTILASKRVSYEELLMLTFRDGKVVAQRGIVDNLSVLRQLGVVSTPPGQSAARD